MEPTISLRDVVPNDFATFFEQEQDPKARAVVAYSNKRPTDRKTSDARWAKLVADPTVIVKTVMVDDEVAGYVSVFEQLVDERRVAYWIGREFWGRNIATKALRLLLREVTHRPLWARVAEDHKASMRVLEKCGFVTYARERVFNDARGEEIDEWVFVLQ
jgi:RimJ/RimL family protein N-acetyltransferase